MDHRQQEQVALHRWAVIAEAASGKLIPAERGAVVREIAARAHAHPDGTSRRYSRGTIDRWCDTEVAHVRVNSQIGGPA